MSSCETCANRDCSVNVHPCRGCFDQPGLPHWTPDVPEPALLGPPERHAFDPVRLRELNHRIVGLAVEFTSLCDRHHDTEAVAVGNRLRALCRQTPDYAADLERGVAS